MLSSSRSKTSTFHQSRSAVGCNQGNQATYTVAAEDGVICIVDADQGKSVTNDAEGVVADLARCGFDLSLPVIYRDTQGVWDQIVVEKGRFNRFASLGQVSKDAAKRLVVEANYEDA
jgi:hypothetical protein